MKRLLISAVILSLSAIAISHHVLADNAFTNYCQTYDCIYVGQNYGQQDLVTAQYLLPTLGQKLQVTVDASYIQGSR